MPGIHRFGMILAVNSHVFYTPMKKFLFALTLFLFAGSAVMAQSAGTSAHSGDYTFNFYSGSFEQALKEAAKKKRIIFVDAYTSWCGPCKMMNNSTFKDKTAGEYFNANLISMKIDMEQGEGPQFAMRYGVRAYPTLLFINHKGEVVHKVLGYSDGAKLLDEAKKALALSK